MTKISLCVYIVKQVNDLFIRRVCICRSSLDIMQEGFRQQLGCFKILNLISLRRQQLIPFFTFPAVLKPQSAASNLTDPAPDLLIIIYTQRYNNEVSFRSLMEIQKEKLNNASTCSSQIKTNFLVALRYPLIMNDCLFFLYNFCMQIQWILLHTLTITRIQNIIKDFFISNHHDALSTKWSVYHFMCGTGLQSVIIPSSGSSWDLV